MEPNEVIDTIKQQVTIAKQRGNEHLHADAVLAYLDDLQKQAGESQHLRKLNSDRTLAQYNANNDHSVELLKAVLEAGKSALHYLVLINGGAVIALLGTLGSLAGKISGAMTQSTAGAATILAQLLALPLLQFGTGVLCGAVGFALRYVSQAFFTEAFNCDLRESGGGKQYERFGRAARWAALATVVAGFVAFGLGVGNSYNAIRWSFG
jgi:hypothetical protein